jgi:hypothetical protein
MPTKKKAYHVTSFDHVPGAYVIDRDEFLAWMDRVEKKILHYAGAGDIVMFTDFTDGRYTVYDLREVDVLPELVVSKTF